MTDICYLFFSKASSHFRLQSIRISMSIWCTSSLHQLFFILIEPTCVIGIKIQLNCWLERRWKSNIKRKLRKIVCEKLDGFHHWGSVILIWWPCALRFVNLIYPSTFYVAARRVQVFGNPTVYLNYTGSKVSSWRPFAMTERKLGFSDINPFAYIKIFTA